MRKRRRILTATLGTSLALAALGAAARNPSAPLSAYGRLPYLEDVALSPDGTRLAFVKTTDDTRDLYIVELSGKLLGGVGVGKTKLRGVMWQDNDNVLALTSITSAPPFGFSGPVREWYEAVKYNIPKKALKPLRFEITGERTLNVLAGRIDVRTIDGKSVVYVPGYYVSGRVLPALFSFRGDNEIARIVTRGNEPLTHWLLDEAGRVAVELEYRDSQKTWTIRASRDNHMVSIANGSAPIDPPQLLGFDATGEQAIVEFMQDGEPVWRPISLKDGVLGLPLDQGAALHGVIIDPRNGRIVGGVLNRDDRKYVFFDNELQAHWDAILRAFPNDIVHLVSHSADFSKIILEVFGPEDGFQYAYFNWYTHEAHLLGSRYKDVTQTAKVKKVTYPAADGLTISAFLTVPRDLAPTNLPLIVLPHGGPAAHDTERFDWWAQALADQGYAVLQPNYRGSDVTFKFIEAGYGEWGRKMQTDLSDGVQYLAKEGVIDPSRVCIVGASYGGYAALAGVTLQSGIYRCAVSVAGVADLPRMRSWSKNTQLGLATRYWDRFWGVTEHDDDALKAISPIDHLQGVTAPILLIHGRDDTVVPYDQSDAMLIALKHAGKSVEMVTLKHEDHWLSSSETRLQMLQATVEFIRAHNPPD